MHFKGTSDDRLMTRHLAVLELIKGSQSREICCLMGLLRMQDSPSQEERVPRSLLLREFQMSKIFQPYARIISTLNVEDEAIRAFYISLINDQSVDEYINERHLHFCSQQVEGCFLSHVLVLTELALALPVVRI